MEQFQQTVWEYYRAHGRHNLPWRKLGADGQLDPYKVLVSELMLQQTQVSRVVPKFEAFVATFPTVQSLAAASQADVLRAWNGLGYNRRAKFLWQAAKVIVQEHGSVLPGTSAELVKLPGVGTNTAGALLAYTYNEPVVFVETNIRTVFIHHFFADHELVNDKDIADLVAKTLPGNEPGRAARARIYSEPGAMRNPEGVSHIREWYWALMDYGTYLKQTVGNLNKQSRHYAKQSAFLGSRRQIRGQVLRALAAEVHTYSDLMRLVADERLPGVLHDLISEGLIAESGKQYRLAEA